MKIFERINTGQHSSQTADKIIHDLRGKLVNIGAYLHASRGLIAGTPMAELYRNADGDFKEAMSLVELLADGLPSEYSALKNLDRKI